MRAFAVVLLSEVQPKSHLYLFEDSQGDGESGKLVIAHREGITNPERDISAKNATSGVT